jgi:hypothetical protein
LFDRKIKDVLFTVNIDDHVSNGKRLFISEEKVFMDSESIKECILSLKPKNLKEYDRTPQRILLDGMDILLLLLTTLFELIHKLRQLPDQSVFLSTRVSLKLLKVIVR